MSTSTQSKPAGAVDRLPLRTKLAYGLGDAGCNMSWTLVGTILMYFYTDVVGISMYAVSALFLISRLWDAINDPMVGALQTAHAQSGASIARGCCSAAFSWPRPMC